MSQYRSSVSSSSTGSGPFAALLCLGLFGLVVWALVCAGQLVGVAVAIAFSGRSVFGIPGLATNMAEGAVFGGLSGLAVGMAAIWQDGRQSRPGPTDWGVVLIFVLIGLVVATLAGAVGVLGLPPGVSNSAHAMFNGSAVPIMVLIGGGIDGPGGAGFFGLAFLFIVVFLMIIALAVQVGIVLHLICWGVAAASKDAAAPGSHDRAGRGPRAVRGFVERAQPVVLGMRRGFAVGVILGLGEAVFTTWGAAILVHVS